GAELLLRDGLLIIRRQWIRPNMAFVAQLVQRACAAPDPNDLAAELQTLALLARWPNFRTAPEDRAMSLWFGSDAVARYLYLRKTALRAHPPRFEVLYDILKDDAVRQTAKAWLISVLLHRLTARQTHRLSSLSGHENDPVAALGCAPKWPAWVAIHRLAHEGGPEALTALQALISNAPRPSPLVRAAQRAVVRIVRRHGGVHTLTGHLSLTNAEDGQLAVVGADHPAAVNGA
ncbi:MAG: hypothetical protein AAFV29_22875, partial [Myxococcota bacterium]